MASLHEQDIHHRATEQAGSCRQELINPIIIIRTDLENVFPNQELFLLVEKWMKSHPMVENKDPQAIANHFVNEMLEVLDAIENGDITDKVLEAMDGMFLLYGLAIAHNIHPDISGQIMPNANGQAWSLPRAIDQAIEIGGNISNRNMETDLITTLIWTNSIIMHIVAEFHQKLKTRVSEVKFYMDLIARMKRKNDGNYPARLFQPGSFKEGRELTADEIKDAYPHVRACLRLIRDYYLKALGKKEVADGLEEEQWVLFEPEILDFVNSRKNLQAIFKALQEEFPVPDHIKVELGLDNRLVVEEFRVLRSDESKIGQLLRADTEVVHISP